MSPHSVTIPAPALALPVPVPAPGEAVDDPRVLETWYDALANVIGAEIPHDLLALWGYGASGKAILLGPAALAQDDVRVPHPAPRLGRPALALLEDMILDAGYAAAAAVPVRHGRWDAGLLLLASFRAWPEDAAVRAQVADVARRIAPTVARVADPAGERYGEPDTAALLAEVARAGSAAVAPARYAEALGHALERLVPHDHLELLVPGASPDQHYRILPTGEGALWADPALILTREELDAAAVAGGLSALVADARDDARLAAWAASAGGVRAAMAVRLLCGERLAGFLLVGSAVPGAYDAADARLLEAAAPIVAARLETLVQGHQLRVLRAQLASQQAVPAQLRRIATSFATAPSFLGVLHENLAEATALLPFHRARFAIRHPADPARVALVVPGDGRPFASLPPALPGDPLVARVLSGEAPHGVSGGELEIELVFPVRLAGSIVGAMILSTSTPDAFTRQHLALAQQLADGLAPFFELERRAAEAAQDEPAPRGLR